MYSNQSYTYYDDTLKLLAELMSSPRGCLEYHKLKRHLESYIKRDMRRLCLHCILCNYIEVDDGMLQLTDFGMDYYIEQNKRLAREDRQAACLI
ncbi:hypothetical protein NM22_00560 [Vibrio tubiashii]|nr:hypothetical protein NM22_00560 [Vibrio tubiashii]